MSALQGKNEVGMESLPLEETDTVERAIRQWQDHKQFGCVWLWIAKKGGYRCLICGQEAYCPICYQQSLPASSVVRVCFQHREGRN
jgi:hypothetical protein